MARIYKTVHVPIAGADRDTAEKIDKAIEHALSLVRGDGTHVAASVQFHSASIAAASSAIFITVVADAEVARKGEPFNAAVGGQRPDYRNPHG